MFSAMSPRFKYSTNKDAWGYSMVSPQGGHNFINLKIFLYLPINEINKVMGTIPLGLCLKDFDLEFSDKLSRLL